MKTQRAGSASSEAPTHSELAGMARVLLDTTVLIDALRGRQASERVRSMRRRGDQPWVVSFRSRRSGEGSVAMSKRVRNGSSAGLRLAPLGKEEGALAGTWRRGLCGAWVNAASGRLPDRSTRLSEQWTKPEGSGLSYRVATSALGTAVLASRQARKSQRGLDAFRDRIERVAKEQRQAVAP